ncbi:hypothetical protein R3P38DRAFT_2600445 [Favolaschia claudopus]|uniref:Uncharacterized protein n=1 Tax=Favolaschia claudopus TaxID=2862362 RepID=A0AAW0DVL7_9AGAR
MTTDDVILQNATYHTQLLSQIAGLDYVPPALKQQDAYIKGLETDITNVGREVKALEKSTKKERKEHESIRDSTARRFAAKITGRKEKFEARASKEEREYIEALEKEMQQRRQQETLDTLIAEAKSARTDLQNKLDLYEKTKKDLAALYSKIFDGPTQGYPEDDRLEYQLQQTQQRYNEIQDYLNSESRAVSMLQSAVNSLAACSGQIQQALGYSQWDMFGGGGLADAMERNALASAEGHASTAQVYVQQAMQASSQVKPIGQISISHGSILTDVVFDNIFTDYAFHQKIEASARNVQAVQYNLTNELTAARGRAGAIGSDLSAAADALSQARNALDAYRRSVFDRLAGGLPAYDPSSSSSSGTFDLEGPITMPRGPGEEASSPSVPTSPPPSQGTSYAPPSGAPPPSQARGAQSDSPGVGASTSYSPPAGPPPEGSRAGSPSAWGSRAYPSPISLQTAMTLTMGFV